MLKIAAAIVIGFFVILYGTGNNLHTLHHGLLHWADGNAQTTGNGDSDWGS